MSYRVLLKVIFCVHGYPILPEQLEKTMFWIILVPVEKSIEDIWGGLILDYPDPQCIFYVYINTTLPWL